MTELEGPLTTALEQLSEQFSTEQRLRAEEQQRHSEEIEALRRLIEQLSVENATLRAANRAARRTGDTLGPGLRDARRDVARTLDVMRQHIRTRDRDRTQDPDLSPGR
ncbi:MAG: hypothetical protein F4Z65_01870 [Acidobacteria bacterium]|nr:hypothetical protein [Acidobacteriota bacterium]MYI40088.1 hypothetical protein [Acidobacteriota bacterium]